MARLLLFKAKYECCLPGRTVHGKTIVGGESRFFITKVLKAAARSEGFDEETTSVGAAIIWDLNCVKRSAAKPVSEVGTEAKSPVLLENKRKRGYHPENWAKNKKKAKLNAYQIEDKKGNLTEGIAKQMRPPCADSCKKKCNTREDRITGILGSCKH